MCYGYSFIVCFEHRHRRQTRRAWTDKKKKKKKKLNRRTTFYALITQKQRQIAKHDCKFLA